jgi:hypothetical protein
MRFRWIDIMDFYVCIIYVVDFFFVFLIISLFLWDFFN